MVSKIPNVAVIKMLKIVFYSEDLKWLWFKVLNTLKLYNMHTCICTLFSARLWPFMKKKSLLNSLFSENNGFVRFLAASTLSSDELDTSGCRMSVWKWLKALKTFSHVFTGDVSFHCNPRSAGADSQGSAFWIPPFVTKIISTREEPKSWKFELNMWQWMNRWLNFIPE